MRAGGPPKLTYSGHENLTKSLFQKFWFVLNHHHPPPVFHRTKCSPLFIFPPFSSRQINCTTRHSYLFISVISPSFFFFLFACSMCPIHHPYPPPDPRHPRTFVCTNVVCNRRFNKQKNVHVNADRFQLGDRAPNYVESTHPSES